jgi:tetratricopeptide (TPR) repeat protein
VLFEMLTGTPPTAHTPPEGPAAGPLRPRDRLAELLALSPAVPPAVAGVVARMLAPRPGDRFATGAEAADALAAPSDVWTPRSLAAQRRRRWGAGALAAVVLIAATAAVLHRVSAAELDPSLYLIMPFMHRGDAAPTLLSGDQCELLLREAFERWNGVRLVDGFRARDARVRRGAAALDLGGALTTAKGLHSGLMVWGEVDALGDSILVRGVLYDVASGAPRRQYEIRLDRELHGLGPRFEELADSLLLDVRSAAAAAGAMGTKDLPAWRAYQAGHEALTGWDLESAERDFRSAVTADPRYPQANYWLAQVEEWRDAPALEWRARAAAALAPGAVLALRDHVRAAALLDMADGRFPQACDRYRALVRQDSLDFSAWYGLGECHAKDPLVVANAASPSGWGFRGSYRAAVEGFTRAFQINVSVHRAFQGDQLRRLRRILFTETNVFRRGRSAPDSAPFAAFPSLDHDTLAFIPYPLRDWVAGGPGTQPPTQLPAVLRNRETLRDITTVWVRAFPADPDALEAHAAVLETMGLLASAGSDERSAIAMIRRARRAASRDDQALRLAVTEARLSLKLEDFARARALADSLLRVFPDSGTPAAAGPLARLAELTGHVFRAARLLPRSEVEDSLVTSDGDVIAAPPPVLEGSLALLAFAAAGGPADSLQAIAVRVDEAVDHLVDPSRRLEVRRAALDFPALLAFPVVGPSAVHRSQAGGLALLALQFALTRGDTAAVRAGLAQAVQPSRLALPGDLPIDFAYQEALLYLRIGDSAAAASRVGAPLDALPTLGSDVLDLVSQSAGLVRAMALRAELAARAGDTRTAARWARGVVALWSDADTPLQAVVARARALTGSN